MKRFAALLICLFIVVIPLFSEILSVLSTKSPLSTPSIQGKVEAVCTQLKYDKDSMAIKVSYVIPNIYVEQDTVLYPGTYFWHLDGCGVATTPGTPSYPQRMEAFVLPGDATNITLRIDVNKRKTFRSYTPTPARCLLSSNGLEEHTPENVPPIPSTSILTNGAPVQIDAITHYRDKTIVYVSFKPCFYWSRLKTTSIFEEMSYTLAFESESLSSGKTSDGNSSGGFDSRLDFSWDCTPDYVLVPEDYLILTYKKYERSLKQFIEWKKRCGSEVHVIYGDNWPSSSDYTENRTLRRASIKQAIQDCYNADKDLKYVIFAGDKDELPGEIAQYWIKGQTDISPYANPQTDFYYQCVDDSDDLEPDLISGRFLASTPEAMQIIVNKIVNYEKKTPQDIPFYNNTLHLAYFQDRPDSGVGRRSDGVEDMSCVHTSEYLRESAIQNGKNVTRIYTRDPTSNVMPKYMKSAVLESNQLLPQELRDGYDWSSSPQMISEKLNAGMLYAFYAGHGYFDGWSSPTYKVPFENLRDSLNLPVVFSGACDTGRFSEKGFAASLLTYKEGGAVAVIAAEQTHVDPVHLRMFRGLFNEFWPREYESNIKKNTLDPGGISDIITQSHNISSLLRAESDIERLTIGKALHKGFRFLSVFSNRLSDKNDMMCKEVFHIFGDPGMVFHTQNPIVMNDVHFEIKTTQAFTKYFVLTLEKPALIGFYNETTGVIERYYGSCVAGLSSTKDIYHLTVQRYNEVPFTITYRKGFISTSAPLASASSNGDIKLMHSEPGMIRLMYNTSKEVITPNTVIELRDLNNELIISDICMENKGEVTLSSPKIHQGYYVVSLLEEGEVSVYKKVLIK